MTAAATAADPDFDQQLRVVRIRASDEPGQLRASHVVADADGQALPRLGKRRERTVVGRQQFARVLEKHRAARRQLHVARRALDESATEPVSLRAGKSEAYRQAIFDSPCRALHETFGGPRTTIPKTCS